MIIYNITFHTDKEVADECLAYLRTIFIPDAIAGGFLRQACLRKVMQTRPEEGDSYAVQFHVKNVETLEHWLDREGKAIHDRLVQRFGNRVAGFTTLLEEIDWENE